MALDENKNLSASQILSAELYKINAISKKCTILYFEFLILSSDPRYVCPLEDQPGSRDKGERQIKDQFFTEHSVIWLGIKSYLIVCPMKRIQTKYQDPNNSLDIYFPDFYL